MRHCRRKDRELENSDENYPKRNNNNKIKAKKKWTVHQMSKEQCQSAQCLPRLPEGN